jgi:hypothetical protein
VRSQLSRAHVLLRGSLESRFGADRGAWAALGIPLLFGRETAASASPLALPLGAKLAGAAAVVAAVLVGWRLSASPEPEPVPLASAAYSAASIEPATAAVDPVVSEALVESSAEPTSSAREPVRVAASAPLAPQNAALEDLLHRAVQIQRVVQEKVLTPDPALVEQHANLLALPDTGLARLVRGDGTESDLDHAMIVRGGGAYYSFARRSSSFDDEPDISYHDGRFDSGFYGNQVGLVAELGDVDLLDLTGARAPAPYGISAEAREAWDLSWREISPADAEHGSAFRHEIERYQRGVADTQGTGTLLARVHSPDEHDHLVAFRPIARDDVGVTIAWRVLNRWGDPGSRQGGARYPEYEDVPEGPVELLELSLHELLAELARLRERANDRLLEVPVDLRAKYRAVVESDGSSFATTTGFARILRRFRYAPLVRIRGGGAYYSFLTRSNSYDESPDLGLDRGRFDPRTFGVGLLLDLGIVPFEELGEVMSGAVPEALSERGRAAFDYLWRVRAVRGEVRGHGRRVLTPEDRDRAAALGFEGRDVPALVGHTYLLRSVLFDDHDHLVVFTVIGEDDAGMSLAWRILKTWPVD